MSMPRMWYVNKHLTYTGVQFFFPVANTDMFVHLLGVVLVNLVSPVSTVELLFIMPWPSEMWKLWICSFEGEPN